MYIPKHSRFVYTYDHVMLTSRVRCNLLRTEEVSYSQLLGSSSERRDSSCNLPPLQQEYCTFSIAQDIRTSIRPDVRLGQKVAPSSLIAMACIDM